jgi:hypothetical protein
VDRNQSLDFRRSQPGPVTRAFSAAALMRLFQILSQHRNPGTPSCIEIDGVINAIPIGRALRVRADVGSGLGQNRPTGSYEPFPLYSTGQKQSKTESSKVFAAIWQGGNRVALTTFVLGDSTSSRSRQVIRIARFSGVTETCRRICRKRRQSDAAASAR